MIRVVFILGLILLGTFAALQPARAQLQGGPNLSPNGLPFTFSPRFGYIGPPAVFVPPPPRPRYYVPGNTVVIPIPRPEAVPPPAGPPPAPPSPPPASRGPRDPKSPALRLPRGSRPEVPCPAGCPRLDPTGLDI